MHVCYVVFIDITSSGIGLYLTLKSNKIFRNWPKHSILVCCNFLWRFFFFSHTDLVSRWDGPPHNAFFYPWCSRCITQQSSWIAMISSPDSHRSILKTSYLDRYPLVDMLQGCCFPSRKKSWWLWAGFSFYKSRKLREACKQQRLQQKCCNSGRTRQNFLFKRRENIDTKGISPPFCFCKSLDFNTTVYCSSPQGGSDKDTPRYTGP